jgi:hypothetical protein
MTYNPYSVFPRQPLSAPIETLSPTESRISDGFIVGLDLGQVRDFTAMSVMEIVRGVTTELVQQGFEPPTTKQSQRKLYHLRHLQRLPLGMPYPEAINVVSRTIESLPARARRPVLVVDQTGCGRPVIDMMRAAHLRPIAITITAGHAETSPASNEHHVPKRALVSSLLVLLQDRRLRIAKGIPEAETLMNELMNFRVKISDRGHDSYGSWRESIHDDLVLSVSLAAWLGERGMPQPARWAHVDLAPGFLAGIRER